MNNKTNQQIDMPRDKTDKDLFDICFIRFAFRYSYSRWKEKDELRDERRKACSYFMRRCSMEKASENEMSAVAFVLILFCFLSSAPATGYIKRDPTLNLLITFPASRLETSHKKPSLCTKHNILSLVCELNLKKRFSNRPKKTAEYTTALLSTRSLIGLGMKDFCRMKPLANNTTAASATDISEINGKRQAHLVAILNPDENMDQYKGWVCVVASKELPPGKNFHT